MKAAIETTAAITHGLTAGRQGLAAEGGALPFPLELSVCESIEGSALPDVDAAGTSVQPTAWLMAAILRELSVIDPHGGIRETSRTTKRIRKSELGNNPLYASTTHERVAGGES